MRKIAMLALAVAAVMLLSGCGLVVKDQDVDNARVIVDVNGETANKQTVLAAYESNLYYANQEAYLYQMYGLTPQPVSEEEVLQETLDAFVSRFVRLQKATALGLDVMSAEDDAAIAASAQEDYDSYLDQVKNADFADTTLEGDELTAAMEAKLVEYGLTKELVTESATQTHILDKLRSYAIADVTVTDEELQALLDEKVASAKTSYETSKVSYGTAVNNGSVVYYAPAGYRFVKQVLVKFLQEDADAISALEDKLVEANTALSTANADVTANDTALAAEDISEDEKAALEAKKTELAAAVSAAQASVDDFTAQIAAAKDAAYAAIQAKADDVYARATAGESFDALVAAYNEDTGMPAQGYAICEGFTAFDEAFVTPAMALANVGEVTAPSKGIYGFYITQYAADIAEGAVALETVRDTLHAEKLTANQDAAYNAALESWIAEAKVTVYADRLDD